jgi:hypothetical protein
MPDHLTDADLQRFNAGEMPTDENTRFAVTVSTLLWVCISCGKSSKWCHQLGLADSS